MNPAAARSAISEASLLITSSLDSRLDEWEFIMDERGLLCENIMADCVYSCLVNFGGRTVKIILAKCVRIDRLALQKVLVSTS